MTLQMKTALGCMVALLAAGMGNRAGQAQTAGSKTSPAQPARTDRHGDSLPDGAIARLGTVRWRHGFVVNALAYSPDGKNIAAVGAGRAITLWDADTGKEIHRFPNLSDQPDSLAFSPDGKILATGGSVCRLWDVATGKEVRRIGSGRVAFSPDGKLVVTAGRDSILRLWDAASGEEQRRIACGEGRVCGLAYSPDGKRIASSDMDGMIRLWDPATGKEQHHLHGHKKGIWSLAFSPDGKRLASSSEDETICLWNPATGRRVRVLGDKLGVYSSMPLAFSPDGALLASGHIGGIIRLWDVADGGEKHRWQGGAMTVRAVTFSPDGKILASGAVWESIRLWEVSTRKENHPCDEHRGFVDFVGFSPDGTRLLSISRDRRMVEWDLATQTPRRQFSWTAKGTCQAALSPDGDTLAAAAWPDYEVCLWDTRTGKLGRLMGKYPKGITNIVFSPDGQFVAYGEGTHEIHVLAVRDGKEIHSIKGFTSGVMTLRFSPDSKALACGIWTQNKISLRLWDVASGNEKCAFQCFDVIGSLAYSPNGKVLATGSADNRDHSLVRLWDTATGKELCRHIDHRDDVGAVAFSPDGKLVASGAGSAGNRDNSVHVWEAATGRLLRRFEGHHSCVGSVAFSPDGLTVASGAGDSTILLWDITGRRADGRWHVKPLTPRELDACWTALANEDTAKAYDAVWALVAAPEQTPSFLRTHLLSRARVDAKLVARLIADLDSDNFSVRQRAAEELGKFGDAITPALQQALAAKPPLEMRRRLQQLLDQAREWTAERLRDHRAMQALEHLGTRPAREVLKALAEGAPLTQRTEEAKAALRRMVKEAVPRP